MQLVGHGLQTGCITTPPSSNFLAAAPLRDERKTHWSKQSLDKHSRTKLKKKLLASLFDSEKKESHNLMIKNDFYYLPCWMALKLITVRLILINARSRCGGSNYSTWTRVQVTQKWCASHQLHQHRPAYFIIDISCVPLERRRRCTRAAVHTAPRSIRKRSHTHQF